MNTRSLAIACVALAMAGIAAAIVVHRTPGYDAALSTAPDTAMTAAGQGLPAVTRTTEQHAPAPGAMAAPADEGRPGPQDTDIPAAPKALPDDPAAVLAALFEGATDAEREQFLRGEGPLHQQMQALYAEAIGLPAAEFAMQLTLLANDWPAAREFLAEHARQTGEDHRELMLHVGLESGQISFDEIMALINSGASLPPLAIHTLARHGQAGEIAALALRGQLTALDQRHPVTGHTAIGSLVERTALSPPADPLAAVAPLATLLELGIDARQAGGELDLLSQILLATEPWNTGAMLAMAAHVVQAGVVTSPEQMALWTRAPGAEERQQLQHLFESLRSTPLGR